MSMEIPEEIKVQMKIMSYFNLALQYYIHARHAIFCYSFPVNGNLTHHAIEMLLHAGLSKQLSIPELKAKYSKHNLVPMWQDFKKTFSDNNLGKHDKFISKYNKWEEIRYPTLGKSDTVMFSDIRKDAVSKMSGLQERRYQEYRLNLEEIDEFFKEITLLIGINPDYVRTTLFNHDAKSIYERDNYHKIYS